MDRSFSRITFLEYRLKAAEAEVSAFKSGKKYQKIHEVHRKEVKALEQEIRHQKEETAQARRDMAAARNHWFEVFEDLQKEHRKEKVLDGELRETQTADYFSGLCPIDCAVPSLNA